jgi:two-component system, NarL family, nitrate/nitrite response regulator NarL
LRASYRESGAIRMSPCPRGGLAADASSLAVPADVRGPTIAYDIISTVVVARRALLREGIASLLQHSPYKVIASTASASELKDVELPPGRRSLVILGINGSNGTPDETAEDISLLRSAFANSKIVVVAEITAPAEIQPVLALGPDGYIVNVSSRDMLLKLLELTLMDQQVFLLAQPVAPLDDNETDRRAGPLQPPAGPESRHSGGVAVDQNGPELSERERQVLTHLAQGHSNKAIARFCSITESTVKVHLKAILRKINAQNRTQAAVWAIARRFHKASISDHPSMPEDTAVSRHECEPLVPRIVHRAGPGPNRTPE